MRFLDLVRRRLGAIGESGAAAIEFAIVGAGFMMMLLAAFELGYMLFVQSVLDNAARDAARLIRTGQAQSAANPSNAFKTLLCSEVGSLIGCGNLIYQSRIFNDWSSAQTAVAAPPTLDKNGNFISTGFSPGVASQIMVVTVTYNYPFFTPWIGGLLGGSHKSALLMSTVVFQNEPY